MRLLKKIVKKLFVKKNPATEDEFYSDFFIQNPSWSSKEPNESEKERWEQIHKMLSLYEKSNLHILDVGCGRGWLSEKLKQYGKVVAIDPVKSVIEYAKTLFEDISFYAKKPDEYLNEFPNEKFDLIISSEVLEHIIDKKSFLKTLHKLLKENGILILTTPRKEVFEVYSTIYGKNTYQPVEEWVSESEIRELFKSTDFLIEDFSFFSPLPNKDDSYSVYQLWKCKKIS